MGPPVLARLLGVDRQDQFLEGYYLFRDRTVLLELDAGQEWMLKSLGKKDLLQSRAATASFCGEGKRHFETMMKAMLLFSWFHPSTHIIWRVVGMVVQGSL